MKKNNVPSCIGGEGMKERIHLYEPFFHHYYIDEILNDYELETLIRVKKDDYQQSIAYIKLISIYSHHASIDELQQQVDSIQMMMETYEDYHEFEQYLIENEEHQVIGIDLCALTYNHHYDELDLEELTPDQYYQVGLYYYDQKKYDQALECFHLGEECEDSDCLCVLGYMYEKGQGVKQSNQVAMTYYRLASDLGNVVASCNLAYFYEYGIDVGQDYQRALHYYEKAAYEGNSLAKYKLGRFYDLGYGCNENYPKAFHWYQEAAKDGLEVAITAMATCYEFGRGIEKDSQKALEYYLKAANMGYMNAQFCLGYFYEMHSEYPESEKNSFYWYLKASHQGDGQSEAFYYLGVCYLEGKGVLQDKEKGIACLIKIEDQYPVAAYLIGQYFKEKHDDQQAIQHFKLAILKEDEEQSLYQLALYGEQGIEVSKEEMLDYLLRSAKKGYSPALVKYAYYLENGIYVEKDYQMAYEYYLLACQKQNREGFYHLGRWFFYGIGQKEDKHKAMQYYQQASHYHYSKASFMLGYMYHYGDGISKDLEKAKEYYQLALQEGYLEAQKELDKLEVEK